MAIDLKQSQRIRTGFAEWAPTYDDDTKGDMLWAAPAELTRMLRPHLHPGNRVFDLGCGTGQAAEKLKDLDLEWTGVDLSTQMLRQARDSGRYRLVRRMNAERKRYPFANAAFDAVVAAGVFEFTDKLGQILKQVRRILAPGGHVAFSVELPPEQGAEFDILDSDDYYYLRYRYSERLVKKLIQDADLKLLYMKELNAYRNEEGDPVRYACFLADRG